MLFRSVGLDGAQKVGFGTTGNWIIHGHEGIGGSKGSFMAYRAVYPHHNSGHDHNSRQQGGGSNGGTFTNAVQSYGGIPTTNQSTAGVLIYGGGTQARILHFRGKSFMPVRTRLVVNPREQNHPMANPYLMMPRPASAQGSEMKSGFGQRARR